MKEKNGNTKTKNTEQQLCKVNVGYERKVKSPLSQYDNISHSINIELNIPFASSDDLDEKVGMISDRTRDLVENEIAKTIAIMLELSQDEKNSALVGSGVALERKKILEKNFGSNWKKELMDKKTETAKKKLEMMEEVEIGQ